MALDVDHVLEDIGQFGPSQWRILVMFFFMFFPVTYQTLIMVFMAFEPPWMCAGNSSSCMQANATGFEVFSTATEPKELYKRRCELNRPDWQFADYGMYEGPHTTIVSEWDLVCGRDYLAWLTNSMLFFGWAVGALILGTLSDWYGRRIILFASCLVLIVTSFAMSFAQAIWAVALCRFIIGFFEPGTGPTMFVYATELVGPLRRALSGTLMWFYFSFALAVMTLQAYYIRDWRTLSIICSAPYIFIMIFWIWIPESVRWLLVHGHKNRARKVLEGVAKMNKREMPQEELHTPVHPKSKGCLELFSSWHLTKITLIQCYAWFVNGMVYYGVSFSAGDFGGSIYLNFLLTSLVEIPANIFLIWSCNRFGRKKSLVWSFFAGAIACIATAFIPAGTNNTGYIAGRVMGGMLGKFFISISFNTIYIFSAELFPTLVRNSGMGLVSVVCRVGGASAPFIVQLIRVHPVLPFAVMGGLTFLAALLCLILPETQGKPTAEVFKEKDDENENEAFPLQKADGMGQDDNVA